MGSVKWEVITEEELNANKGGEAGQTDNPAVKPSASGGFTNDPSDLGLEMTDSEDEGGDVDIDSEDNSRLSAGDDSRMSDSMSNTQEKKAAPPGATSSPAPSSRSSRQDQLQEQRMAMMHLASKKKELEHNIANCPNEALRNRFRQELQGVQNDIKRLEGGVFS